jgi:hypothetical protein
VHGLLRSSAPGHGDCPAQEGIEPALNALAAHDVQSIVIEGGPRFMRPSGTQSLPTTSNSLSRQRRLGTTECRSTAARFHVVAVRRRVEALGRM